MNSFPPPPPRAELWGGSLFGLAEGLEGFGVAKTAVEALLAKAGIHQRDQEAWYPMTAALSFLAAVEADHGREALRSMGRAIPESSRFAPDLDDMERTLRVIEVAYQVNHRGGPIGGFQLHLPEPGRAELVCENPYPCDLDLGLLERLLERAAGGSPRASVVHRPGPACRRLGARACVYDLRW